MIEVNGVQLDFNMMDADFFERYIELASEMDRVMELELTDEEKKNPKNVSALFRKRCKAVKQFLDELFGKGTGERVCGEKDNLEVCLDAYMDIINGVHEIGRKAQERQKKRHAPILKSEAFEQL